MKLFKLTRIGGCTSYDQYDSFIVRAESEERARKVTAKYDKEFDSFWLDSNSTSCTELKSQGNEKVIIGSFNAG